MMGIMGDTADLSSMELLNSKRKLQAELLGMPLPKQMRKVQSRQRDSLSDNCTMEIRRIESAILAEGRESEPKYVRNKNSFPIRTDLAYPKTRASDEASASFAGSCGPSSTINIYSSENSSWTESNSIESEASFNNKEHGSSHHKGEDGFYPSFNHEEHIQEFGSHGGIENNTDEELENLLYSNGVTSNDYVLSSGRSFVNQDVQNDAEKTIDQEFEQYFSMLTL